MGNSVVEPEQTGGSGPESQCGPSRVLASPHCCKKVGQRDPCVHFLPQCQPIKKNPLPNLPRPMAREVGQSSRGRSSPCIEVDQSVPVDCLVVCPKIGRLLKSHWSEARATLSESSRALAKPPLSMRLRSREVSRSGRYERSVGNEAENL